MAAGTAQNPYGLTAGQMAAAAVGGGSPGLTLYTWLFGGEGEQVLGPAYRTPGTMPSNQRPALTLDPVELDLTGYEPGPTTPAGAPSYPYNASAAPPVRAVPGTGGSVVQTDPRIDPSSPAFLAAQRKQEAARFRDQVIKAGLVVGGIAVVGTAAYLAYRGR